MIFSGAYADSSYDVTVIADGLTVPWAIDFAVDGRIFFTERGGAVRVIQNDTLLSEPALQLDTGFAEGGLLGLALDPDFETNHYLYLYYTYTDFIFTYNKVVRFVETDDKLVSELTLIEQIPGGPFHDGGRIKFGDDGKLYITTGDAGNPGLAQDLDSLGGKILRINSDGSIPADNPFDHSPVYSYGHRNPQGLDWHPDGGRLVATEHGPSGERGFAHDEINVIRSGQNFGWPDIIGDESKQGMQNPILHSGDMTWAPSGASFYDSDAIPQWTDKFLVATLAGSHMMAIDLDLQREEVKRSDVYFLNEYGRLRDISVDSHGNVYILTSNQDGRGSSANGDVILRISPTHDSDLVLFESPKKQLENVSDIHDIMCNVGLSLVFKNNDWSPACVKPQSIEKLIQRGWASDHIPEHYIHPNK